MARFLGGPLEPVFLHGMHLFEVLLRDVLAAGALCTPTAIIALHDRLPLNATMTDRHHQRAVRCSVDAPYPGWWTGDVWKPVPILRRYRPDLTLPIAGAPPTGLDFAKASQVLRQRYDAIVAQVSDLPGDGPALAGH